MNVKEVAQTLERFAPLPLQESYDNAGLQIGLTDAQEVSGVLLCLDVTEAVIDEAKAMGCNLIVSHHPLMFRPVKRIDGQTMVTRCIAKAIAANIAIYSAHTNLDNADDGVNYCIAGHIGLIETSPLRPVNDGGQDGSGLIGILPEPMAADAFLKLIKDEFKVKCLMHNGCSPTRLIKKVALCGGAGDFLLDDAIAAGADAFLTGEMGYHHFFGYENRICIGVLGHYQSEQYTVDLLAEILHKYLPDLRIEKTSIDTNPIQYLV